MISFAFNQISACGGRFIPAPDRLYSSGGSLCLAATTGAVYGLIGRVIYPRAGIIPLHYAIWFAVAYQIKECINLLEGRFEDFIGVRTYLEKLEQIPEDELDLEDWIRYYCWKIINVKNNCIKTIDSLVSKLLDIRPYQEVMQDNVQDASFLEMCRYRVWHVFKSTIIHTVSITLGYQLTAGMGFTLPSRTSVRLLLVIQSVVKGILLVPALHVYARFCNKLADEIGEEDERAAHYRITWIRRFLPAL